MENAFPCVDADVALDVAILRRPAERRKQILGAHDASRTDRKQAKRDPRCGRHGCEQGAVLRLSLELTTTHDPPLKGLRQIVIEAVY
jgi:hypothetical protein